MTDPKPASPDAAPKPQAAPPPAEGAAKPAAAPAAPMPVVPPGVAPPRAAADAKPVPEPAKPATPAAKPAAEAPKPAAIPEPPKPQAARPVGPPAGSVPPSPPPASPRPAAPPSPEPHAASGQPMRAALPVLTAIGFIFVLLAVVWVWNSQRDLKEQVIELAARPAPVLPPIADPSRVAALEARVSGLDQRLNSLEQRLTTLENRPAPPAAAAPSSLSPDNAAALANQLGELETRLKTAEQRQGTLAQKEALAARLAEAQAALAAGKPLGDIPGAPPALARFAEKPPPTEAALRLGFPAAAAAAAQASRPSADGKSFAERVLMHVSSLLTVKEGTHVVVGAPAATVLGEAQTKLDAGDLAGAVAALDGLDSAAAQAMADWRSQAQALLDARAALAQMARG